jgi:hypothetical protein
MVIIVAFLRGLDMDNDQEHPTQRRTMGKICRNIVIASLEPQSAWNVAQAIYFFFSALSNTLSWQFGAYLLSFYNLSMIRYVQQLNKGFE